MDLPAINNDTDFGGREQNGFFGQKTHSLGKVAQKISCDKCGLLPNMS